MGARVELAEIGRDLMEQIRVLDVINRWRYGKDPEVLAEWQAARGRVSASPRSDRPSEADKEGMPPGRAVLPRPRDAARPGA